MYVRPLHPTNNQDSYITGEVTIHPSAAIAPGVLLQASPNSRIIIGAGVCIGMGSILHAHEGTLEVEAGASLGAGVLVVGKGKIGAEACIGSTTTIMNCSVESRLVVPPGSLLGDNGRQISLNQTGATVNAAASHSITPSQDEELPTTVTTAETISSEPNESDSNSPEATITVHGQVQLNRLLSTMFPHRQALNRPLQDGKG